MMKTHTVTMKEPSPTEPPPAPKLAPSFRVRIHQAMNEIPACAWDALLDEESTPFMQWSWLESLERSGCVGAGTGWSPRHLGLYRGNEPDDPVHLIAAAPAYVRNSSEGDFSQDWGWAEAVTRAGAEYYPKLSITVPFTPATGRRILVHHDENRDLCLRELLRGAKDAAANAGCSCVQALFSIEDEAREMEDEGWAHRLSFQFHWKNRGYRNIDDFLSRFDSKKRNQIKRERAAPGQQGITIRTVRGDELKTDPSGWAEIAYDLHRSTIEKLYWGKGWLNLAFYELVFERMAHNLEIVEARKDGRLIAGAFNVASATHLYGRYWGCHEEFPFLHFNVCLYHSISECIERGISCFEGGAGGGHKLARGFEPSLTHSAHHFFDPRIDRALRHSLTEENRAMTGSLEHWQKASSVLKKDFSSAVGE